jgi:hypothetical protein
MPPRLHPDGALTLTTAIARRNATVRMSIERSPLSGSVKLAAKKKARRLSGTPDYCLDRA